ncbi:MAG: PKD domain-containing protein, partial [Planctomycetota bacterium]
MSAPIIGSTSRLGRKNRRRRHLAEMLEDRRLLAADTELSDPFLYGPLLPATIVSTNQETSSNQGRASTNVNSFGEGLRQAVREMMRVIEAVSSAPELISEIPYLGSLSTNSVGGTSQVDTVSIRELFHFAERFESTVVEPLEGFLASNPLASSSQLVAEFDFLEPVLGLGGTSDGVRLNFSIDEQYTSRLDALVEPITSGVGSLFDAVDGDALGTELPIDLSLDEFSFQFLRDASQNPSVSLPAFNLELEADGLPIGFEALTGFLAGTIRDGSLDFGSVISVDPVGFGFGTINLDELRELSTLELLEGFEIGFGGGGLQLDLPFEFDLPGFDTGGLFPKFQVHDANPFDAVIPQVELTVPEGAPFSSDSILGFGSINATALLGQLETLGDVFGGWEEGSLLDFPVPLAEDLTLGEAIGLAESYGSAVLQFLTDDEGFPTFNSIQELTTLIPGLVSDATDGAALYDPETQILTLSLDFMRSPEPINAQADLSLIAGQNETPITSFEMTPGASGLDNRLMISRATTVGLQLEIDLSREEAPRVQNLTRVAEPFSALVRVPEWTPLRDILRRRGLESLVGSDFEHRTTLQLADGRSAELEWFGLEALTIGDVTDYQGQATIGNEVVAETRFIDNKLVLVDWTEGPNPTSMHDAEGFFVFFFDQTSSADGRIESQSLAQSELERSGGETLLSLLLNDLSSASAGTVTAPLRLHLASGEEVLFDPGQPIGNLSIDAFLAAFDLMIGDRQVARATLDGSRFVIHDLTSGDRIFRIEWAGNSIGSPLIERLISLGDDSDGDGKIAGPRLISAIGDYREFPVGLDDPIGPLLQRLANGDFLGTIDTATIHLRNGDAAELSTGLLTEDLTVRELLSRLRVFDDGGTQLVFAAAEGGSFLLLDASVGDAAASFEPSTNGFFSHFFGPRPAIDNRDAAGAPQYRSASFTAGVYASVPLYNLIDPSLTQSLDLFEPQVDSLRFHLRDGTTEEVTVTLDDLLSDSLQSIADQVRVERNGDPVIRATVGRNGLVIEDLSAPAGRDSTFRIEAPEKPLHRLVFLPFDRTYTSGVAEMNAQRLSYDSVATPPDILQTTSSIPTWTPMEDVVTRLGWSAARDQTWTIALRRGDSVDLTMTEFDMIRSVQDAADRTRVFEGDAVLVSMEFVDGRFEIVDHTAGPERTEITQATGLIADSLFTDSLDFDDDGRIRGADLSRTLFHVFEEPSPAISLSETYEIDRAATPLEIHFRDGTTELIELGPLQSTSYSRIARQLRIKRPLRTKLDVQIIDNRYVLTDLTSPVLGETFSIDWGESFGETSSWPGELIPIASDANGDGVLTGKPFLPELPASGEPPINAETRLGEIVDRNPFFRPLLNFGAADSIQATLRSGQTVTLTTPTIADNMTLGELTSALSVNDGDQTLVQAELIGDRLVLTDQSDGTGDFQLETDNLEQTFFTVFGLIELTETGDATTSTYSLSTARVTESLPLSDFIDGLTTDDIEGGTFRVDLADGSTIHVDLGMVNADTPLSVLLERTTTSVSDRTYLKAELVDGSIQLVDLSTPDPNEGPMTVRDVNGTVASAIFAAVIDSDRDGNVTAAGLAPSLGATSVSTETTLDAFSRAAGVEQLLEPRSVRLDVRLSDGGTRTIDIVQQPTMTLDEFGRQFVIQEGDAQKLDSELAVDPESGDLTFVVRDYTNGDAPVGEFQIVASGENADSTAGLFAAYLGLVGVDTGGTGVIESRNLRSVIAEDRVRVRLTEPPTLRAEIGVAASSLNASAKIGELLAANFENGYASATAVVEVGIRVPEGQEYLTLSELAKSVADPAEHLNVSVDADLTAGGEVAVDLAGLNVPPDPDSIPRIDVTWDDLLTSDPNLRLQPENFQFTTAHFDNLVNFKKLTLEDITNLIRRVVVFLETVSGEGLLDEPLPLVNRSLGDVLDTVDAVNGRVEEILADPNASLDTLEVAIEDALGLQPDDFTLTFDSETQLLKAELNLSLDDVNETASFDVDLSRFVGPDLADFTDQFVDFSASGSFDVTAAAEIHAHLGLDLNQLRNVAFDDAVVLFESTGIVATASASASDLDFETSILSLGVAATGSAAFDRDGINFGSGSESTEPAELRIAAVPGQWPGGVKPLSSIVPSDFEIDFDENAAAGVDLQLTTSTGTPITEAFQIKWDDLDSLEFGSDGVSAPGNQVVVPDLSDFFSDLTLADSLQALASGLQALFGSIDQYLGDEVLGVDIPFVGDALGGVVNVAENFTGTLAEALAAGAQPGELVSVAGQRILFDVLGPGAGGGGLDVLRDANGDGQITLADVEIVLDAPAAGLGEGEGVETEARYRISLGRSGITASTPLSLDVGGSGLGLEVSGDASVNAEYGFDMVIGFTQSDGAFVEFGDGADLFVGFDATIDDLVGDAKLGPLAVSVATIDENAPGITDQQRARVQLSDGTSGFNGVAGRFALDFPTGRFELATIASALSSAAVTAEVVGGLSASIDTGINTSVEGIPSIVADLHLNFDHVDGTIAEALSTFADPQISITNAGLDLGSFVSNVLAPILRPVNDFLDPIRPVLEQLTTPIPVLSELIGPTTYVDLISAFGDGGETVSKFVDAVAQIVTLIDIPINSDELILPLGDFSTAFDSQLGKLVPTPLGGSTDFDSFLGALGDDVAELRDYLASIPQEEPQFSTTDPNKIASVSEGMFSIPLLQNPASAIGLLFGDDVDLIKYQAPQLNVGFDFQIGIPVFPVFNITVGGQLNAIIDFAFGYDTVGIRKFAESRRSIDLLDGFFFDDRAEFDASGNKTSDVPELTFRFAVTAGGELDLKAAKAGVEVGLGAALLLDLNDPDLDGKVRFDEVQQNLQLGNAPGLGPLWVFDASGQLDAFLTAYAKAFGVRVQATLGPKVLIDFDFPRPQPASPTLGRIEADGRLVVHVGPESEQRIEGDLSDGDDVIFVSTNEDNGSTVITGFGTDQEFEGVTSVFIDAGFGDDKIVIDQQFTLPVTVLGGYGDDDITGGGGRLTALGGWGDDVISGGSADDELFGEGTGQPNQTMFVVPTSGETVVVDHTDADLIDGGLGDDVLFGGPGIDQLQGGAGNDELDGGDGEDYVGGGDGDDVLRGGADDDVLSGDKGNDLAQGGPGLDFLQGGPGADRLEGGDDSDELFGGTGADELLGGDGDDLLVGAVTTRDNPDFDAIQAALDFDAHTFDGGEGNDLIYGTAGPDTVIDLHGVSHVFTYEGADVITTGPEGDLVRSGSGDDDVDVGGGQNRVFTGEGFDVVRAGDGPDLIDVRPTFPGSGSSFGSQVIDAGGSNRIFGDSGPDLITVTGIGDTFIDAGDGDNRITTSFGDDTIRTGNGLDTIDAGDGNNEVSTGAGDDVVTTGLGNDNINTASGTDWIDAGPGADSINAGPDDDLIIGGLGGDTVFAGTGRDIVWGGLQFYDAAEILGSLIEPSEFLSFGAYSQFVAPSIQPLALGLESVHGEINDGNDFLNGGPGNDFVFGGGGDDDLIGGSGDNFLDGGAGIDFVFGGPGVDLIRGGEGDDDLNGGLGIDLLFGGEGDDTLRGDGGDDVGPTHLTFGQMLFGGPGNDTLLAYANTTDVTLEATFDGDRLDGGDGLDLLRGNLRREVLIGGGGKDILEGDRLGGPSYASRQGDAARLTGADDDLFGGPGDDQIFAHGGDDTAWGGSGTDILQGHAGVDLLRGGTGIDLLYLDTETTQVEQLDGFFGNEREGDTEDDNATDVLVVQGTPLDDTIKLGGSGGRLVVEYKTGSTARTLTADFRNPNGDATLRQFQIDTLGGDDWVEFLPSLSLGEFAARSRDWVSVVNAGSGDDTVLGSVGRDRISGGPGSDVLLGLDGNDRLFGDDLDGNPSVDSDRLFAGGGNDDLFGGVGTNQLYAWSDEPSLGNAFGRFVDPNSGQVFDDFVDGRVPEDTGLNRMLGRDGDDDLFGGTVLDFLYGGGGTNRLIDVDGNLFEVGAGVPSSEAWLEYARSTDAVWYYGATNADDVITVDFVTEPGVLGDHHLITRLTENNGLFTFDAQVQLDFSAVDEEGQLVWDPNDLVVAVEELGSIQDVDQLEAARRDLELSGNLLPPEGDYSAIVIDAKAGDDEIFVGPTVQRSVWVSAGEGDDVVEITSGTALLVDRADSGNRNDVPNNVNDFSRAFFLEDVDTSKLFTNLTLDSPNDVDWYQVDVADLVIGTGNITVDSISPADEIRVELWERESDGTAFSLFLGMPAESGPDPRKPARVEIPMDGFNFDPAFTYFIRVQSGSQIPTQYDLGITFDDRPFGDLAVDLGNAATDDFLRRDVIVGGPGRDRLQGGPSEDWVIGGEDNDILSGGFDRGASDVLIGEGGDDLLQVFLDRPPIDNLGFQGVFTLADELEGGDGFDQVLIQGGDVDSLGNPIRDHLTLSYNIPLGTTTVAGLVWDAANKEFLQDSAGELEIYEARFQTRDVEGTLIDLRGGDDELHLEADYQFAGADPQNDPTYGISPGDRQAGGRHLNFQVLGGDGNDRIFGSPYGDWIDAGAGIDFVSALEGDDDVRGGADDDVLSGGGFNVTPTDRFEASTRDGDNNRNDAAVFATPIELTDGRVAGLTFHQGDAADWYVLPLPDSGTLSTSDFADAIVFDDARSNDSFHQTWNEPLASVTPAVFDLASGAYLPTFPASDAEAYLLGITNPRTRAIVANSPIDLSSVSGTTSIVLSFTIDGGRRFGGISFQVSASTAGPSVANNINERLEAVGLDDEVFAEFDERENRLLLVLRQSGSLQVNGSTDQLELLGFAQSQMNSGAPTALGSYSIATNQTFTVAAGPDAEPKPYAAELSALREIRVSTTDERLTLAPAETTSLRNATRLDGEEAFGKLRLGSVVGDLNGDGFEDLVLSGDQQSLILFGPVDTSGLNEPSADLSIDLSGPADQPNWTTAETSSDIDGDGLTDLFFHRFTRHSGSDVDLEVAVLTGAVLADGASSVEDDGVLAVSIDVTGGLNSDDVELAWMDFDSSPEQELLVFTSLPVIEQQSTTGYGGVLLGSSLAGAVNDTRGPAVAGEMVAWMLGGIESESTVLATLPKYEALPSSVVPLSLRQRTRATVADVDGDGQDEIIVSRPLGWLFQNVTDRSEYLTVGRNYVLDVNGSVGGSSLGTNGFPAVIQLEASIRSSSTPELRDLIPTMNPTQPLLAGDLDLDGTDELIVAHGVAESDADLLVFEDVGGGIQRSSDARLQIDGVVSDVSQLRSMGLGDFDGDHHLDLVVGADRASSLVSEVRVVYDPMTFGGTLLDLEAATSIDSDVFRSLTPGEELGTVAQVSKDFTGDGIADLALGAGAFDAVAGGIETNAGTIFLVPGQLRPGLIANVETAILLENTAVRGIGGAVVDLGANVTFEGTEFRLSDGGDSKLYRFRTLGDGAIGDVLRIGPGIGVDPIVPVEGLTASLVPGGDAQYPYDPIDVGGPAKNIGLIEFDLGKLMAALVDPDRLLGAELQLLASSDRDDTEVTIDLLSSDGDGFFRDSEEDWSNARALFSFPTINLGKDQQRIELDLAPVTDGIESLRELLKRGERYLTARITTETPDALVTVIAPDRSLAAPTGLLLRQQPGAIGTLLDEYGRVLQADSAGFDLRNLDAGTFYLEVKSSDPVGQVGAVDFALTFDAPALGAFDAPTDNDFVRGNDGDDIVIGGPGKDSLIGDSGTDSFTAEFFEPKDLEPEERLREPIGDDRLGERVFDDPLIVIDTDLSESAPRGVIEIADHHLALAIADAIGVSIVATSDGGEQFARPIRASELGGIVHLDLSGVGLFNLAGIEALAGLVSLDLSDNGLFPSELDALRPTDTGGTINLQFLNLDRNAIDFVGGLAELSELQVLSVNFNGGEEGSLNEIDDLRTLEELRYASFAGADIESPGGFFGTQLGDDNEEVGAAAKVVFTEYWRASTSTAPVVGDIYHYADAATGAKVTYQFPQILPGQYEVLATWRASEANAASVHYEARGVDTFARTVNQRAVPFGEVLGGVAFERLATIDVSSIGGLDVSLSSTSDNGLIVADAILIRPTVPTISGPLLLDLTENSIGEGFLQVIADSIEQQADVTLRLPNAAKPIWSGPPTAVVGNLGERLLLDVSANVSVSDGQFLSLADNTLDENLIAFGSPTAFNIRQLTDRVGSSQLLLTARSSSGRSATTTLEVGFGGSIVEGRVFEGVSDLGIAGATAFLDVAGDGQLDVGTDTFQIADLDGVFQLFTDATDTTELSAVTQSDWSSAPTPPSVPFSALPQVLSADVKANHVIRFDLPATAREGDYLTPTFVSPTGTELDNIRWTATGPVTVEDVMSVTVGLDLEQSGVVTVTLEAEDQGGVVYQTSRTVRVIDVAPTADAGPDVTIIEGPFSERRSVIEDAGDDVLTVTIDYGDGSEPTQFAQSGRFIDFDHFYATPGRYTVGVRLEGEDGSSFDSFDVTVEEAGLGAVMNLVSSAPVKGNAVSVQVKTFDGSFQADRFLFDAVIDWGDGTTESIGESITYTDGTVSRDGVIVVDHEFETEGTFTVTFTQVDDDGNSTFATTSIPVGNDLPVIFVNLPTDSGADALEDTLLEFTATATDVDGTESPRWDFGDGTPIVVGDSVQHAYSLPGTYSVTVEVRDGQGASTTVSRELVVSNVPDAPMVQAIPTQAIVEGQSWVYAVQAIDADAAFSSDPLEYRLLDTELMDGISIDADGVIRWTPSVDQGPNQYQYRVEVSKAGVSTVVPVTIDVFDSGSIDGLLFEDTNGNGFLDADESLLSGVSVGLDVDDDGSLDTTVISTDGRYRFERLRLGVYRVVVGFDLGWEVTTPGEVLVEIDVSTEQTLPSLGARPDSDGDGVSNLDEQNSPAGLDGNSDGIADWQQANVVSVQASDGPMTIVSPIGTLITDVAVLPVVTSNDTEAIFPHERISFNVAGLSTAGRATVEFLHGPRPSVNAVFAIDDRPNEVLFRQLGQSSDESVLIDSRRTAFGLRDGSTFDLNASDGTLGLSIQLGIVEAPQLNRYEIGRIGSGIAAADNATGSGFLLFSEQSVFSRFPRAGIPVANSDHLLAVRFQDGLWSFNNNAAWVEFQPVSSDRLLAATDFDADTVESFRGRAETFEGIELGYSFGDLSFAADRWNGNVNDGEFTVNGTYFEAIATALPPVRLSLGLVNRGIAVEDNATGTGFILYSDESVHTRFRENPPMRHNSDHLIAVQHIDGQWYYNNNQSWFALTPRPNDRLIAAVDFGADTIKSLEGADGTVHGIVQGFVDGDLMFFADRWNGSANDGEFTILGTSFRVDALQLTQRFSVGAINKGIAVEDAVAGQGYVLLSAEPLADRLPSAPFQGNSERLVAVQFRDWQWHYNNNFEWSPFTPLKSDRLIAGVDFDNETMIDLKGRHGRVNGVEQGYVDGDLTMLPLRWD